MPALADLAVHDDALAAQRLGVLPQLVERHELRARNRPRRILAGLAGIGGGRDRGLRLIEEAAARPSDVQANARFTLIAIYNAGITPAIPAKGSVGASGDLAPLAHMTLAIMGVESYGHLVLSQAIALAGFTVCSFQYWQGMLLALPGHRMDFQGLRRIVLRSLAFEAGGIVVVVILILGHVR